jgi:hypothetical protein
MPNVDFSNVPDLKKQDVADMVRSFFENNAPGFNAFKKGVETLEGTDKGYRIPYFSRRPGGHTGYVPSSSDFNAAIPMQTISMFVFPVGYALPIVWQGNVVRGFQKDQKNNIKSMLEIMKIYTETATKRLNQMFYGDGSGALAFSASTIGATGVATLNCTTAAAATAGQTKGAVRLEESHVYNAINASTGAIRGTFTVLTPGKTSASINVTSGTITSGDPIVDANSYSRYMRGLAHLISDQNRTLQGLNTANFTDLNAPVLDLNGTTLTPAGFETIKSQVNTRNNSEDSEAKLQAFITFGQHAVLRKQGYNLGFYVRSAEGGDTVKGVAKRYEDGDTVFVRDADMDEDRVYLVQSEQYAMFEEMPFGEYNIDGQEWRMLLGANNTGSDNYQRALGCRANPGTFLPRASAFIKRASLSGVVTQATA